MTKILLNPFLLSLIFVLLLVNGANPWIVLALVVALVILRADKEHL